MSRKARGSTWRKLDQVTGKFDYRSPNPDSRGKAGIDPGPAARVVYSGRELQGSYRRYGNEWLAFSRRGKPIGKYATEREAADAISAAAGDAP